MQSYEGPTDSIGRTGELELEELEYLKWFKQNADFGPADEDVHHFMDLKYEKETGHPVPKNWRRE